MARQKNAQGYCDERATDVQEQNLCDYFKGKRRNSKARCRNCSHFHVLGTDSNKDKDKNSVTKQDDV